MRKRSNFLRPQVENNFKSHIFKRYGFFFECFKILFSIAKIKGLHHFGDTMSDKPQIDIDYVARLARLELTDEEKSTYGSQLGSILEYFEKLNSVDVEGIEPSAHPFHVYNVWAEDEAGDCFPADIPSSFAAKTKDGQVLVPKVVADA